MKFLLVDWVQKVTIGQLMWLIKYDSAETSLVHPFSMDKIWTIYISSFFISHHRNAQKHTSYRKPFLHPYCHTCTKIKTPPTIVQCKENSYYCISLLAGIKIPLFWYREWENRQASCSWWDVKTRKLTNALQQSSEKYFFFWSQTMCFQQQAEKIKPVEENRQQHSP